MKKFVLLVALLIVLSPADAQIIKKVLDRVKQRTEDKIAEKVSEKASDAATKPIDSVMVGNKKKKGKNDHSGNNIPPVSNQTGTESGAKDVLDAGELDQHSLITYSKFDFVPGDKVLAAEDFAQDAVGDFPARWNTNGSGEVVTVAGQQGHWLMVNRQGRFTPDFIRSMPENFTFQFDVICNERFTFSSEALQLFFLTGGNGKEVWDHSFIELDKRSGVKLGIHPSNAANNGGIVYIETFEDGKRVIRNELGTAQFNSFAGKTKVKVSVWRQKQRMRVYLNEEKVVDLPRAFAANRNYDMAMFEIWSAMHPQKDRYLIGNIVLSAGAPDTRNKLITEGKFVTRGILFDVNSDKIKPESNGVLKDIANVLTENPDVKVKIIGHTDADGGEADNLALSKRRAEAVKNALADIFKVAASRIETGGMGETQPADKNSTPEGKANNRRVEFIRM